MKFGKRLVNAVIYILIYGLIVKLSFDPGLWGYQKGALRGGVIGIPLVLLIVAILTVYYTRKSGGDWRKVRQNLKHNFLSMLDVGWRD